MSCGDDESYRPALISVNGASPRSRYGDGSVGRQRILGCAQAHQERSMLARNSRGAIRNIDFPPICLILQKPIDKERAGAYIARDLYGLALNSRINPRVPKGRKEIRHVHDQI